MEHQNSGPLTGLRVVALPWQAAAKVLGMVLADCGATVVEVRSADCPPEPGLELADAVWQRGKTLLPLDDAAQLAALLARADVFITDFSAEELRRLDAAPKALVARYPALVCLQISGYGAESARAGDPWSEALVVANSGLTWRLQGNREGPKLPSFPAGSYAVVFNGITGICAALHARHASGRGQVVDTSIHDGIAAQQPMSWWWVERDDPSVRGAESVTEGALGRLVLAAYRCSDGEWMHIHTGSKGAFSRLMKLAGLDDRIPPIPTEAQSEIGQPIEKEQLALIHAELPRMFASKRRDEWLAILRDLDIATMPDLRPGEVFTDQNTLENELSAPVELPSGETVRAAGAVLKFSATPGSVGAVPRRPATTAQALAVLGGWRPVQAASGDGDLAARSPLAGLRVLDFGIYFAGPYASRLLGDLGAEVIKLENLVGCPMRPISGGRYFNAANHSKRSLALNLKRPEAREIVARLVRSMDVVHHNLRPGVAESLGMGYRELRQHNPRLIYCHSPAYGSTGPYRDLPGFEPLSSAVTGLLMRRDGCMKEGPLPAIGSMDPGNGMLGAAAILMALYHRDRTGEGQAVECPQMGSAILSTPETVIRADGSIVDPCWVDGGQYGFSWWKRLYQTAGGWLVVDAYMPVAREALLGLAGAEEDGAAEAIAGWAVAHTTEAALAALRAAGVPAESVAPPWDAERYFFDAENERLGRVVEYRQRHPRWGRYRDLALFWRFSHSPLHLSEHHAPAIGEHSREILSELGLSGAEIDRLMATGVVGTEDAPTTVGAGV